MIGWHDRHVSVRAGHPSRHVGWRSLAVASSAREAWQTFASIAAKAIFAGNLAPRRVWGKRARRLPQSLSAPRDVCAECSRGQSAARRSLRRSEPSAVHGDASSRPPLRACSTTRSAPRARRGATENTLGVAHRIHKRLEKFVFNLWSSRAFARPRAPRRAAIFARIPSTRARSPSGRSVAPHRFSTS